MRRLFAPLAALGVLFALGAPMSAWASVPRVITAEDFGYPG
jgi:hypothetical protein